MQPGQDLPEGGGAREGLHQGACGVVVEGEEAGQLVARNHVPVQGAENRLNPDLQAHKVMRQPKDGDSGRGRRTFNGRQSPSRMESSVSHTRTLQGDTTLGLLDA